MLIDTIVLERSPGEQRAALLAGDAVWQVDHFRDHAPVRVGALHRGRVTRVDPGVNAAFVALGDGPDGFLRARDAVGAGGAGKHARIAECVHEGAALVVQITADAHGTKGPRVTAAVRLSGYLLDLLPAGGGVQLPPGVPPGEQDALITAAAAALQPGEGARLRRPLVGLVRHAPAEAAAQVAVEAAALRAQWQAALATSEAGPACLDGGPPPIARVLGEHAHPRLAAIVVGDHATRAAALRWAERAQPALAERIVLDAPAPFAAHDVDAAIDAALAPCVPLASGAALIFEAGETLTAIDVDTAQHLGRAGRTARDVGHEAVPEIARQLRMRSIGGAIVIDLLKSSRGGDRGGRPAGAAGGARRRSGTLPRAWRLPSRPGRADPAAPRPDARRHRTP